MIIHQDTTVILSQSGHCRPHLWKGPPALPWPDTGEEQGGVEPLDEVS